mmetsp:Transcript_25908/g.59008  ORF Transcript_25908/g.59008 Transcript_25908/m.59008 type:complete len:141 (+) Transcript_25908:3-425(+)
MSVTVARYRENTGWTEALQERGATMSVRPTEGNSELISFLRGLLDGYDSERNVSVFLHGSGPTDWHSPSNLLKIVQSIDEKKLLRLGGYASLNLGHYSDDESALRGQSALFNYRMDCLWKDDEWVRLLRKRWHIGDGAFQ